MMYCYIPIAYQPITFPFYKRTNVIFKITVCTLSDILMYQSAFEYFYIFHVRMLYLKAYRTVKTTVKTLLIIKINID